MLEEIDLLSADKEVFILIILELCYTGCLKKRYSCQRFPSFMVFLS